MKTIKYTKKQFDKDINTLATKIKKSKVKFSYIVALSRGGLIPGVVLSHKLDLKMWPVTWSTRDSQERETNTWIPEDINDGHKILIVDDIVDSGDSLVSLIQDWDTCVIEELDRSNIYIATLIYNKDQSIIPQFYANKISRKKTPEWFEFWWEK